MASSVKRFFDSLTIPGVQAVQVSFGTLENMLEARDHVCWELTTPCIYQAETCFDVPDQSAVMGGMPCADDVSSAGEGVLVFDERGETFEGADDLTLCEFGLVLW